MEEVTHVPAESFTIPQGGAIILAPIALREKLLSNQGKDKDDDGQDEGQVAQGPHGIPNDLDKYVQGGPGLG